MGRVAIDTARCFLIKLRRVKRNNRWSVLLPFACLLVCGCETFIPNRQPVEPSVVATWWDGPRIRPGISLVVQVSSAASQPHVMPVLVDQNGEITLPHLLPEPVPCDGLTLDALKQKLVKAYSKFYRQPMVSVTFAYDGKGVSPWGTVTVVGEVVREGPVNMPSTMDLTVTKILQEAGGCKPFADKTRIRVTRCDKNGGQSVTIVNIDEIGKGG